MHKKGRLYVFTGPSGTGKGTILGRALAPGPRKYSYLFRRQPVRRVRGNRMECTIIF